MNRGRCVLMAVAAMAAAVSVVGQPRPAAAQGFRGPDGHGAFGGWPGLPALIKNVGLTDVQQGQVRQIVANHRPQFEGLLRQLRGAREALDAKLYGPGPVTAADLDPLVRQIDALRSQLTQEGLRVALEIRGILTPEQLAKADQTRQRLSELRRQMRDLLQGH